MMRRFFTLIACFFLSHAHLGSQAGCTAATNPTPSSSSGLPNRLLESESNKRLIARYANDDGLETLKNADVEPDRQRVIQLFRLAAITVASDAVEEELRANPNIEAVRADFDRGLGPRPPLDDEEDDEDSGGRRRLQLRENMEYGITLVQADQLFDLASDAKGKVNVCVVDTGTEDFHPDLPNSEDNNVTGTDGFRLTSIQGTWDNDGNGHGTHCAGVIGAIGDNNKGVVGVRKNPDLFSFHIGKGLNDVGSGQTSSILQAAAGCRDAGAKVLSMSLGGSFYSDVEEAAYQTLYDEGFLIVAAAGNAGSSDLSYPASYPTVISVAAVNKRSVRADFSQYNNQVELSGPGVNVRSTWPGNTYETLSGTSMACPHVAGVAAEVWSHFPECTNNQIRNVLLKTAKDLGTEGYDEFYGFGLVQAKDAYDMLARDGCEVAGGPVTTPLSDGAKGGCEQDIDDTTTCPTSGVATLCLGGCSLLRFSSTALLLLIAHYAI